MDLFCDPYGLIEPVQNPERTLMVLWSPKILEAYDYDCFACCCCSYYYYYYHYYYYYYFYFYYYYY